MSKLEHERTEWFSKIQKEPKDFLLDVQMQKRSWRTALIRDVKKLRMTSKKERMHLRKTKRKNFNILLLSVGKELEYVNSEMRRLDAERREINLDCEKRNQEWVELNNSIEELKVQREKLEKQPGIIAC
ncbi:Hypothetical predicted protein [Olea europaea subsp. europaea]|uniref:Uncharacterized protein n=1 Tax=Olea europaea subsp. europaea TaxID=158383 RepID=A0A8S0TZ91_OLEEU|nr:Hypothetical predicted protein [Olea europaea subsp. europaea]